MVRKSSDRKGNRKGARIEIQNSDGEELAIIRMLPRHRIYLDRYAGDGPRFAELFKETWALLPVWVRRRLLKHWRDLARKFHGKIPCPSIELVPEIAAAWGSDVAVDVVAFYRPFASDFSFLASAMDTYSADAVKCVIAHELAHCLIEAQNPGISSDPDYNSPIGNSSFGWLPSQAECDAHEFVSEWGFDLDAEARAAKEFLHGLGFDLDAEA